MKCNYFRDIVFSIGLVFCLTAAGCTAANDTDSQSVQNENGTVIAISIFITGGEEGIAEDWSVYPEENKYMLSYIDHYDEKPEVFEITEEEYQAIMSIDYARCIAEYNESDWEGVADAMYYQSTITYENGTEESTKAIMWEATSKLNAILTKYMNEQT